MTAVPATEEKRRTRVGVLISYGILAVIGAAFFALSFQYDFSTARGTVGPAFLPRIVGGLTAVLGLGLVVQELRTGSVLLGDSGAAEAESKLSRPTLIKLVSVFGLMTVALLSVPLLGLILPLTLLVFVVTVFVERMPLITSIIVTISAAVVAYVLFVVILRFPIPMGILEGIL